KHSRGHIGHRCCGESSFQPSRKQVAPEIGGSCVRRVDRVDLQTKVGQNHSRKKANLAAITKTGDTRNWWVLGCLHSPAAAERGASLLLLGGSSQSSGSLA